jgi:hypothetical protein
MIKKEIRRDNYLRLREAGYSSRKSNKFKDYSQETIKELIVIAKQLDSIVEFLIERNNYGKEKRFTKD